MINHSNYYLLLRLLNAATKD